MEGLRVVVVEVVVVVVEAEVVLERVEPDLPWEEGGGGV